MINNDHAEHRDVERFGSGPLNERSDLLPSLSGPRSGPESARGGRTVPDPAGTTPEGSGLVWRRTPAGPSRLLVGFAVYLAADLVEQLRVPALPGLPAALLLGVAPLVEGGWPVPWTRAGDGSVAIGVLEGLVEDPVEVARAFPWTVVGWPQHWPGVSLDGMVPDRLRWPMLLDA